MHRLTAGSIKEGFEKSWDIDLFYYLKDHNLCGILKILRAMTKQLQRLFLCNIKITFLGQFICDW